MSQIQEVKAFKDAIRGNVSEAIKSGVPLQNIILELAQQEFKVQFLAMQMDAQQQAREMAQQIVPAGSLDMGKLPFGKS